MTRSADSGNSGAGYSELLTKNIPQADIHPGKTLPCLLFNWKASGFGDSIKAGTACHMIDRLNNVARPGQLAD